MPRPITPTTMNAGPVCPHPSGIPETIWNTVTTRPARKLPSAPNRRADQARTGEPVRGFCGKATPCSGAMRTRGAPCGTMHTPVTTLDHGQFVPTQIQKAQYPRLTTAATATLTVTNASAARQAAWCPAPMAPTSYGHTSSLSPAVSNPPGSTEIVPTAFPSLMPRSRND